MIRSFLRDEAGSTAVEYALISSLIAMAILGALTVISQDTSAMFDRLASGFTEDPTP